MEKIEIIARRILGWKLQSTDKWFNPEKNYVIERFQPEENLEHAMLIVERLKEYGFTYSVLGEYEVNFHTKFINGSGTGNTLQKAITNAAFSIAENNPIPGEWF